METVCSLHNDVQSHCSMIPFVLCIVPVPDRVSSPKSLLSQMTGKGMGYGDASTPTRQGISFPESICHGQAGNVDCFEIHSDVEDHCSRIP